MVMSQAPSSETSVASSSAMKPAAGGITIRQILSQLRSSIRRYLFWQGFLGTLALVALWFWGSFLLDEFVFSLTRFEIPRWLRALLLVTALGGTALFALWKLGTAMARQLNERALAMVLERRFPQLDSRLILAVEANAGQVPAVSPMHDAMVARTLERANQDVTTLDLGQVFNPSPFRRSSLLASILWVPIALLAVMNFGAVAAWANGYLKLSETYRDRQTELIPYVLAQPGERKVPFKKGIYRHPKGSDLTLQIETAEGKLAPPRVRLDYRLNQGRGSGRTYLQVDSAGQSSHTFTALLDNTNIWLTGGDYTTLSPLQIQVVDPPIVSGLSINLKYPDYTGLNTGDGFTSIPVIGTEASLPLESTFELQITAPQPLSEVRCELQAGPLRYEVLANQLNSQPQIEILPAAIVGQTRKPTRLPENLAKAAVREGGKTLAIPFRLHHKASELLAKQAAGETLELIENAIPLPPDTLLRLWLVDAEGIAATEPAKLLLRGIPDEAPQVETALRGIGTSITRLARIPVTGEVNDDYGVDRIWFEYSVDADTTLKEQPLGDYRSNRQKRVQLERSAAEPYVRFDVLPLDLAIKQKLTINTVAADANDVADVGPNVGRGQRFVFSIVSPEELLSILYAREINERKRFEQLISEVQRLRDDLVRHRDMIAASRSEPPPADKNELLQSIAGCGERSLYAIRQAAQSTDSVRQTFREIREELVNNSVDTPQMLDRIDRKIVDPLSRLMDQDFPSIDATIGLFRLANEQGSDPTAPVEDAILQIQGLLETLDQVLLEMRKLETFHEALELLKAIIGEQDDLAEKTKQRRKAQALKALED
ncbi:hypothetical protein Spb1_26500 [Planctopirus ephydatiae]|uniref:Polyketide synthase n=2 Tax=Planctopirus ephydatiae TaxID=2528019 RepID=A0A518GQ40_9PLAN|nr:hypothetical protein Spb1_26500 [Planctopirus ephydatiae]